MFKVIVAEDELPLLRGLACLIERLDSRFEVVFKAKNGKEALEYLTQQDADILFTDINMPVLNGLQLIEQAQQVNPHLMTVIISGYSDFEYARQAMRFGTKNYLLKPIDRNELQSALQDLAEKASQDVYKQKRSALIEFLHCGNSNAVQEYDWKPLTAVSVCLGAYQGRQNADEVPKAGALADDKIWKLISAHYKCNDFWLFLGQRPNEAVWIFESKPEIRLADLQSLIQQRFKESFPITAAYKMEIDISDLLSEIAELSQWIMNGVVLGESHLMKSCPDVRSHQIQISDKSALRHAVQKQHWDEFSILVQRIVEQLHAQHITQLALEDLLTEILELVMKEHESSVERDPREIVQELISGSEGFETLFCSFFKYCRDLAQNTAFDINDKEMLMQSMDEYILRHIQESLTLQKLSQRFGLVAPYLSKLFKAYKGMSPTQYIQEIRIESAKRMLLENPSMLAKDIAEALGYSNPLYFSKTFYKHVGMYPSDYRVKNKQE